MSALWRAVRFSSKSARPVATPAARPAASSAAAESPLQEWEKRDVSTRKRYGAWNPTKKLSRQHMQNVRDLAEMMPTMRTVDLANHFRVSPEAIRRILKSSWVPDEHEEDDILKREDRRREQRKQFHDERERLAKAKPTKSSSSKFSGSGPNSGKYFSKPNSGKFSGHSAKPGKSGKPNRTDARHKKKPYDMEQIID